MHFLPKGMQLKCFLKLKLLLHLDIKFRIVWLCFLLLLAMMLLQVVTQLSAPRKRWPPTISSWGRNMVFRFGHSIGSSESLQQPAVRRKLGGRWLTSSFTRDQSPGLGMNQRRTHRQVDMQPLSNFYWTRVRSLVTHSLPVSRLN